MSFAELKEKFRDMPTSQKTYEIDGVSYIVVSHYTGKKDIDEVMTGIAEHRAYADFGLSQP